MVFLFCLFLNLGVEPIDLPEISLFWRDIKKDVLLELSLKAMEQYKFDLNSLSSCLALFKIEQPAKVSDFELRVPNNNSSGWHPWKKRYPWGWSKSYFVYAGPDGYFRIRDKKGLCFYFSFRYLWDCLVATTTVVRIRGIYNGKVYGARWVGNYKDYPIFDKYKEGYKKELLDLMAKRFIRRIINKKW